MDNSKLWVQVQWSNSHGSAPSLKRRPKCRGSPKWPLLAYLQAWGSPLHVHFMMFDINRSIWLDITKILFYWMSIPVIITTFFLLRPTHISSLQNISLTNFYWTSNMIIAPEQLAFNSDWKFLLCSSRRRRRPLKQEMTRNSQILPELRADQFRCLSDFAFIIYYI